MGNRRILSFVMVITSLDPVGRRDARNYEEDSGNARNEVRGEPLRPALQRSCGDGATFKECERPEDP